MENLEKKIIAQQNLITSLQEKISILEIATNSKEPNLQNDSVYPDGSRRKLPDTREEMALEFFEIFEELFSIPITEEILKDGQRFSQVTDDARAALRSLQQSVARVYQDFILAQYARDAKGLDYVFANALDKRNEMTVISALEMINEYFFRTELLYQQMQRRIIVNHDR